MSLRLDAMQQNVDRIAMTQDQMMRSVDRIAPNIDGDHEQITRSINKAKYGELPSKSRRPRQADAEAEVTNAATGRGGARALIDGQRARAKRRGLFVPRLYCRINGGKLKQG